MGLLLSSSRLRFLALRASSGDGVGSRLTAKGHSARSSPATARNRSGLDIMMVQVAAYSAVFASCREQIPCPVAVAGRRDKFNQGVGCRTNQLFGISCRTSRQQIEQQAKTTDQMATGSKAGHDDGSRRRATERVVVAGEGTRPALDYKARPVWHMPQSHRPSSSEFRTTARAGNRHPGNQAASTGNI